MNLEQFNALVARERARQIEKWGVQQHPSVHPDAADAYDACMFSMCPTEDTAKEMNANDVSCGSVNWAAIAIEELSEAISAAGAKDKESAMKEIVEVAAVCAAWFEDISSRDGI